MSVLDQINKLLSHILVTDVSDYIAEKMGCDAVVISNIMREYLGQNAVPVINTGIINKSLPPIKPSTSGVKTCPFVPSRGKKDGKTCGTIIRGPGEFCSKHKNRKTVLTKLEKAATKDPKTGRFILNGTKFVVKSATDHTVIGKLVGDKYVPKS